VSEIHAGTEEDVNSFGYWVFLEILIYPRKQLFEQIRPTVDIADRVNAQPFRQ